MEPSNPNYDIGPAQLKFEFTDSLMKRAEQLPNPQTVIGPFQTGTWGIVAAAPGVGKSMWMQWLITQVAAETPPVDVAGWNMPERRHVLLIDAEMGVHELASRYSGHEYGEALAITHLDLLDRLGQPSFSLGNPEDQAALTVTAYLFDVIIIDNIEYTLDPAQGHNIWAPETWAQVAPLTHWAKANNKLLILVDHTNKEGGVQGSLSKQRGASFVITLESEYIERADLAFTSHFKKYRNQIDRKIIQDRTWWLDGDAWQCKINPTKTEQVVEMSNHGLSAKEIGSAIGLSKSQVYRIINRNRHLIDPG